jgi:Flp pilus assembly protein TadB
MAQTKKKRQRKRRGTQSGSVSTSRRAARPRTREEARARAKSQRSRKPAERVDRPPTWRGAAIRGIVAAVIFTLFLAFVMSRPFGAAIALGAFMLAFYIPAGYFIDRAMWRRRERARIREGR